MEIRSDFRPLRSPIFPLPGDPQIRVTALAVCAPDLRLEKKFYHKIKRMERALARISTVCREAANAARG